MRGRIGEERESGMDKDDNEGTGEDDSDGGCESRMVGVPNDGVGGSFGWADESSSECTKSKTIASSIILYSSSYICPIGSCDMSIGDVEAVEVEVLKGGGVQGVAGGVAVAELAWAAGAELADFDWFFFWLVLVLKATSFAF